VSNAEVHQARLPKTIDDDIGRLDISMDDAVRVQCVETLRDCDCALDAIVNGQATMNSWDKRLQRASMSPTTGEKPTVSVLKALD
jgi:hypothetical protein